MSIIKIEFFADKTGCIKKGINLKWDQDKWLLYEDLTPMQVELIWDTVKTDKRIHRAFLHLAKYDEYSNKKEILRKFIYCNWSKLDNKLDINGRKVQFENISCPLKSSNKCPHKGIVCIKHK